MKMLEGTFDVIWQTSVSAAVLIGLGVLVLVCFGRVLPAWGRYGIWLLVFLRLVVPVAPPASFSVWNLGKGEERPVAPVVLAEPAGYQPAVRQSDTLRYERSSVWLVPVIWVVGIIGWMVVAVVRHQRLARWVRRQGACGDVRVLALVDRAREAFAVRTKVAVICHERFDAPAVFGLRRVLLPGQWLKEANDEEVYLVLLHEMTHIKHRDTLVNWICIIVRAVHWFNPLVWYAFRRLRRERELFCDALVLRRLRPPERAAYGNALIKIAERLSGAAASPTLVPVLQHKPEIHRRIHMIANYKPMAWALSGVFALMLLVLAGITFTRAAEKASPAAVAAPQQQPKRLEFLETEVAQQQKLIRRLQAEAEALHTKLYEQSMDAIVASGPNDAVQKMQTQQIEAQAEHDRLLALYEQLNKHNRSDLKRLISTVAPDPQLTELLRQLDLSEQKLVELVETVAPEHPDVKRIGRVVVQINKQIEDRIDGIMRGLEARREAQQAYLKAMDKSLAKAKEHHFLNVRQSRAYQDTLQELRAQEEILQRLRLRLVQEKVDQAIERGKTN
jgi:beta-lactamase regulating signal transducer with metallopeptidase domain